MKLELTFRKQENILINDAEEASISDFGLGRMSVLFACEPAHRDNPEFVSPFDPPEMFGMYTGSTKADVFSFGGIILQVLISLWNISAHVFLPFIAFIRRSVENVPYIGGVDAPHK